MFRGVQHINMDAKGRLAMPARQREPLHSQSAGQIVITIDTQVACLVIYPLPEWERVEKEIQGLPALKPAVKRFQRLVLGYATDLELDGNGRMLLPAPLPVPYSFGRSYVLFAFRLWINHRRDRPF